VNYGSLLDAVNRIGNALQAIGCQRGDRILIALPDSLEFVATFFGAAKIGVVPVPVSPFMKAGDYSHFLSDSDAKIAVIDPLVAPEFEICAKRLGVTVVISGTERNEQSWLNWQQCAAGASPFLDSAGTGSSEIAFILYSSGSTAARRRRRPKKP